MACFKMSETQAVTTIKPQKPLSAKTKEVAVIGGTLLISVALIIGMFLHLRSLNDRYTVHAYDVASYARMAIDHNESVDTRAVAEEVMTVYRGLSEEARRKPDTSRSRRKEELHQKRKSKMRW